MNHSGCVSLGRVVYPQQQPSAWARPFSSNENERAVSTTLQPAEAIECKTHAMLKDRMRADLRVYRDAVSSVDFMMTAGDSQFLMDYVPWRMANPIAK